MQTNFTYFLFLEIEYKYVLQVGEKKNLISLYELGDEELRFLAFSSFLFCVF